MEHMFAASSHFKGTHNGIGRVVKASLDKWVNDGSLVIGGLGDPVRKIADALKEKYGASLGCLQ